MIVYTQGSFDILHKGHINLLKRCHRLANGGPVIVALVNDEAYERYRGYKPSVSFENRRAVLAACKYVTAVRETDITDTCETIRDLHPDYVSIGSDWANKDIYKQYGMTPEELDPMLVYFPYTKTVSSTEIKKGIVK